MCLCPCLVTHRLKAESEIQPVIFATSASAADAPISEQEEMAREVMKIYLQRNQDGSDDEPTDAGILIEGITVLSSLGDLSRACCYLLGLP